MNKNLKFVFLRTLTLLILITFPFIGSDCEEFINQISTQCQGNAVNVVGTWKFVYYLGGLRDICSGETVTFNSNGTATLQCPNRPPITRSYTINNNLLKYTETNMQYCLSSYQNNTELQLTGVNNNRILYYQRISSDEINSKNDNINETNSSITNSSEGY